MPRDDYQRTLDRLRTDVNGMADPLDRYDAAIESDDEPIYCPMTQPITGGGTP